MNAARLALVAGMCLPAIAPTSALSDWQYTKWDMTPTEVATASNGQVECHPPSAKYLVDGIDYIILCSGKYSSGIFTFNATFLVH
jgi:hypothetical protein